MYAAPTYWNAYDLNTILLHFDGFKKYQDTFLSEVLCKIILNIYRLMVPHEEEEVPHEEEELKLLLKCEVDPGSEIGIQLFCDSDYLHWFK